MKVSLGIFCLAEVPIGLEKILPHGEFFMDLSLLLAVLVLSLLVFAGGVIWLGGYTERFRERCFPLHACDQQALAFISEGLEKLGRESGRYDFIAHRVRYGTWHGREWAFVWGIYGAITLGEGGLEWGGYEGVFVLAPRSEEESLRKLGGMRPFIVCGKDQCILRLEEPKIREVTF